MNELNDDTYSRERLRNLSWARLKELRDQSRAHRKRTSSPELESQQRESILPLSFAQERLWFLDQLGLVGAAYNMAMALKLEGDLNVKALECSFAELMRRHESLRTHFESAGGNPFQVIDPPHAFVLQVRDLSGLPEAEKASWVQQLGREEANRPFDLTRGPLLRASLLKLAGEEHVLLLTMHHIVSDGWSLGILRRELSALYDAYCQGKPSPLPDLRIQYVDYAIWQRESLQGEVLEEQLRYWRNQLSGSPPQLQLPSDRPRPALESFKGSKLHFELPARLIKALRQLARHEKATLFMAFLSAYQVLLSRWSGQRDVVVGSPVAGRAHRQTEGLIGSFVNALALRTEVSEHLTFRELLERVRQATVGAYAHQDVPFELLVKELRPDRSLTRQPIFQVMLAMQNYPEEPLELSGLSWNWTAVDRLTTHFDLTLYLYEDGLSGIFEYATDLFERGTIERMARAFRVLLEGIVGNPDEQICELQLLDDADKQQFFAWNDTAVPYPQNKLVHELFEEQVERTPNVTAVEYETTSLTYAELNSRANRLARYLISEGIGPDRLVGICVTRSTEMIVGLLAILKAGGAYVPLDPSYPVERLQHMLEDSRPQVVLTQELLKGKLPVLPQTAVISLDTKWAEIAGYVDENLPAPERHLGSEQLVYVIYTSGSTGRPKGTAMPHRSMVNLIEWHRRSFVDRSGRRVLQFAALSFDVAFQETFSTLCTGGTLLLLDDWLRRDPRALAEFMSRNGVERLFVPPMMLQSLAECCQATAALPRSLQDVITAGEQLRIGPEVAAFFEQLPGCRLHNHYGPTETHVVTAFTLTGDSTQWPSLPSIGRPIANTQIHVLDGQRRPVPIGVAGEIYVGGAGVAREYLNRSQLTAERFIQVPLTGRPTARLYRTGDIGRWRADGTLEYVGRNDDQVKIRGFRIELGDIESQLRRHAQVKEAAVIAREDVAGEKRLVAYITRRDGETPRVEELRSHTKAVLPEHMVPSAFVILESLPVTPNGKLDRRALPVPTQDAYVSQEYEAPQGEVEQELTAIWQELLRVEHIGRHDNFFELGGHSLHGIKLIAKVSDRFEVRLSAVAVFQFPTVQEMAKVVESLRNPGGIDSAEVDFEQGVL